MPAAATGPVVVEIAMGSLGNGTQIKFWKPVDRIYVVSRPPLEVFC